MSKEKLDYNVLLEYYENNDVVNFCNLVKLNKLSLNEVEYNLNNKTTTNTINLKVFLLSVADNLLGEFYEGIK